MSTISRSSPPVAAEFGRDSNEGPLSLRRLRRTKLFFLALGLIGLAPMVLHLAPTWQAAGLGLLFPGGGFIAVGGWAVVLCPIAYLLYRVSLFAWFATGAIVAPVIAWAGAAAIAGAMAGGPLWTPHVFVVLALVAGREIRQVSKSRKTLKASLKRREERDSYLPAEIAAVIARAESERAPDQRELSEDELASIRYVLDRGLQAPGDLSGFTVIDQFQTSALRYQINNLGYALAVVQCHYTPSFHGYLSLAQRNLIERMLDKKIWGYWRWEALWGKLSLNFDPAGEDNIMLTGFFGLQVALYMGNTGDQRYAKPGSLTFRYSDRVCFAHDIHSIVGSVVRNYQQQAFCLYPCEPNWVYTPCNFMGMQALRAYDRVFSTNHFASNIEPFAKKLNDEFTMADGSVYALRSSLTGYAVPFPFGDDGRSLFTNPVDDVSARTAWAMARHDLIETKEGKTTIRLKGKGLDMGNYKKGHAATLQNIMSAAREFGDTEVAEVAERMLNEMCSPSYVDGVKQYTCSNSANTTIVRGRILRRNDWRKTVVEGPPESVFNGPLLTDAAYPEVLVAKAFSGGIDLQLVLYPGKGPGLQSITVERLVAGTKYVVRQQAGESTIVADGTGSIMLNVQLDGRTALTLVPAA